MIKFAILSMICVVLWPDRTWAGAVHLPEQTGYADPVDFSVDGRHAFIVYARYSAPVWETAGEGYDVLLGIYDRKTGVEVTTVHTAELWDEPLDFGPFPAVKTVPYGDGVVVAVNTGDRSMNMVYVDRLGNVRARRRVENFPAASLGRQWDSIRVSTYDRVALFDGELDLQHEWFSGDGLLAVESAGREMVALHGVLDPSTGLYAATVRWVGLQRDQLVERTSVRVPIPVAIFPAPKLLIWPEGLSLVTHDGAEDWRECRLVHSQFQCGEPAWGRDVKTLSPWVQPLLDVRSDRDGYVATLMNGCAIWSRRYDRHHSVASRQLAFPSGSSDLGFVHSLLVREWGGNVFLLTSASLAVWDPVRDWDEDYRVVLREAALAASPPVRPTPSFEGCPAWSDLQFAREITGDKVKSCVAKGADPNAEFNCGAWTRPLSMAARQDKAGAVRALLEAGADVNARDDAGNTALHIAARYGSEATAQALLDGGADASLRNAEGKLAWDIARDNEAMRDPAIEGSLRPDNTIR